MYGDRRRFMGTGVGVGVFGSKGTTDGTPDDRSDENDSSYQHDGSPFLLAIPWNGMRRIVTFLSCGESGLVIVMPDICRRRRSCTHAIVTRQQVDIIPSLEADSQRKVRIRIRLGSKDEGREKRRTRFPTISGALSRSRLS